MPKIPFLLIGAVSLFEAIVPIGGVSDECRAADEVLKLDEDLADIFTEMTTRFELNKVITPQQEPLRLTLRQDYSGLRGRNYDKMVEICEDDLGYESCDIISRTVEHETFDNIPLLPIDSIPVIRETVEIFKPICFPNSCSESQIDILDPAPAGCNPLVDDCEIQGYDVMCSRNREEPSDTSSCAADAVVETSYKRRENIQKSTMSGACASLVAGGSTFNCRLDFEAYLLETITNFTTGRDEVSEYAEYELSCLQANGKICDANITANYTIPNFDLGEIILTEEYVDFPLCLSSACSNETDQEEIAVEAFRRYTSESLLVTDCDEGICEVIVNSITCRDSLLTLPPTMSPTTSAPTITVANAPGIEEVDLLSPTCRAADTTLKEVEVLSTNLTAMTSAFEVNKTRFPQPQPLEITVLNNYTGVRGFNYNRLKEICEDEFQYDLCEVTSTSVRTESFGDVDFPLFPDAIEESIDTIPVSRETTEIAKPICFPKSCSDDNVSIVYPNPGNCNPSMNPDCETISYEVSCPSRNITNSSTCAADMIPEGSPYYVRANLIEATVLSTCAVSVARDESDFCSLETGSYNIDSFTDYSTFRHTTPEFSAYESSCYENGGQICDADLTAAYVFSTITSSEVTTNEHAIQFPFCLSDQCLEGTDLENVAVETFRKFTAESLDIPSCTEETCEVIFYSLSCHGPV